MTDILPITVPDGLPTPNPFQPGAGPLATSSDPGSANHGMCSLSFMGKVFRFRTNPNEIWWDYQLITHVEDTYGGRVVQILGTRLGDLTVKVECGKGGWPYLMKVVLYLRDMLSDQRGGQTAEFEYTTRNWKLKVYALNLPFQDEWTATTRELTLGFKIQEDVSGVVTSASLNTELARLQEGIYTPNQNIHNQYNDGAPEAANVPLGGGGGPSGYGQSGVTNQVDNQLFGDNPAGANPLNGIPFLPSIPGFGSIFGGFG